MSINAGMKPPVTRSTVRLTAVRAGRAPDRVALDALRERSAETGGTNPDGHGSTAVTRHSPRSP